MRADLHLVTGALGVLVILGGCGVFDGDYVKVSAPFYIASINEDGIYEPALFRCPSGPGAGCAAVEGLPGPTVKAAGADSRYVVIERENPESRVVEYYYFARIREEKRGWGNNAERIVGPLDKAGFLIAKAQLRLPDLTARVMPE